MKSTYPFTIQAFLYSFFLLLMIHRKHVFLEPMQNQNLMQENTSKSTIIKILAEKHTFDNSISKSTVSKEFKTVNSKFQLKKSQSRKHRKVDLNIVRRNGQPGNTGRVNRNLYVMLKFTERPKTPRMTSKKDGQRQIP